MNQNNQPLKVSIKEFVASKQITLFKTLKQPQFSGQLLLRDLKQRTWIFYLYLGRIVYATGGIHPVRRWLRNVLLYVPKLENEILQLQDKSYLEVIKEPKITWEYDLLSLWGEEGKISREQITRIIREILVEVFFDLTQTGEVTYQFQEDKDLSSPMIVIDADQVIIQAWKEWQAWQAAKLADRSPNATAIIKYPEQLKKRTSPQTYQIVTKILSKQQSLRDLALNIKPSILQITRLLKPYIQAGLIELIEIPDLPEILRNTLAEPEVKNNVHQSKYLIACVNDSDFICNTMEAIINKAGYQFLGITEPESANSILSQHQPDLIIFDLEIPNIDSYKICKELKEMSFLRDTPMVILNKHDSLVGRIKAKMLGATDVILKPIDDRKLLDVLQKNLPEQK